MAVKVTTSVKRTGKAAAVLQLYTNKVARAGAKGLEAAAVVLMDASLKLVPKDTEALSQSARITSEGEGFATCVYVGYGGRDLPPRTLWSPDRDTFVIRVPSNYALIQHERHDFKHPNGGQANYLGEPSKTHVKEMADAFLQRFKQG